MSLALAKLFELFSPSDYEAFDEEEIGYAGGLCLPEVCMALKGAVQTVYQYSVTGGYEKSFDYRGVELFNQRGCLILSDVEQMVFDEATTTYATEPSPSLTVPKSKNRKKRCVPAMTWTLSHLTLLPMAKMQSRF